MRGQYYCFQDKMEKIFQSLDFAHLIHPKLTTSCGSYRITVRSDCSLWRIIEMPAHGGSVSFFLQFFFLLLISASSVFSFNSSDTKGDTHTLILQDVLKKIAATQEWHLESTRISNLDAEKVSYANAQRYEIRIGFGDNELVATFSDEISSWNAAAKAATDFGSLITEVASLAVLSSFKVEGPFDLRVEGDDLLSLMLPMNIMHIGLKRLIVGEGIIVEVSGAREVSVFHDSDLCKLLNQSTCITMARNGFDLFWSSLCLPLLPIRIIGSAKVIAYKSCNANSRVRTTFTSKETIELLADRCRSRHRYIKEISCVDSLNSRLKIQIALSWFSSLSTEKNRFPGYVKGTMEAFSMIRFRIELERNVGNNESAKGLLADWRTRPTVERAWYEVSAEVENEKLNPVAVKKVKPFIIVESTSWSTLTSNISFTQLPSSLVHSEALTLGIL